MIGESFWENMNEPGSSNSPTCTQIIRNALHIIQKTKANKEETTCLYLHVGELVTEGCLILATVFVDIDQAVCQHTITVTIRYRISIDLQLYNCFRGH